MLYDEYKTLDQCPNMNRNHYVRWKTWTVYPRGKYVCQVSDEPLHMYFIDSALPVVKTTISTIGRRKKINNTSKPLKGKRNGNRNSEPAIKITVLLFCSINS